MRNMLSSDDTSMKLPSPISIREGFSRTFLGEKGKRKQTRQPWIVFTAGCMGAGKTHVMCLLNTHGLLPLPHFVRVDMDRIRAQ